MRKLILLFIVLFLSACACGKGDRDSVSGEFAGGAIRTKAHGSIQAADYAMDASVASERIYSRVYSPAESDAVNQAEPARLVNYRGSARLESPEPETVIDTVVQRAAAAGGMIRSRRTGFVSLLIPVTIFKPFFESVLSLGRVVDKRISARDITEAFADNAAALRIAESTLARLQELLAAATAEMEKLALLKEIQRISEEIEQRKLQEKDLLSQANFSTIDLSVQNTPLPEPVRFNFNAFGWFASLASSHCGALDSTQKVISMDTPLHFVKVEENRCAASARNSEFFAFERENNPQGSVDFWTSALIEFFKTTYQTELKKEDAYTFIRLQSYDADPKVIYIAVLNQSDQKTLKIACAFFPNADAEKADAKAILDVLGRVP